MYLTFYPFTQYVEKSREGKKLEREREINLFSNLTRGEEKKINVVQMACKDPIIDLWIDVVKNR